MELTKLYVLELANGEKHFFGKETDRNWFFNMMSGYNQVTCKRYEISLFSLSKEI